MATHKVHQHINTFSSEKGVLVHATIFEPAKNGNKQMEEVHLNMSRLNS